MGETRPETVEGDRVVLTFRASLVASAQQMQADFDALFAEALGRKVRVEIRPAESQSADPGNASQSADSQPPVNINEHPLVKQAVELFGGRVTGTGPRRRPT